MIPDSLEIEKSEMNQDAFVLDVMKYICFRDPSFVNVNKKNDRASDRLMSHDSFCEFTFYKD